MTRMSRLRGVLRPAEAAKRAYTLTVVWSEPDKEYLATCPEFPSLSWLAKTPGDALKQLADTVAGCIADLGEETP
jgi:predicted RNase H-like HicB family nuclease